METGWASEILLDGEQIGLLGLMGPTLRHQSRMVGPMAVAEMKLLPLLAGFGRGVSFSGVPQFPAVRRDLALVAPRAVRHQDIVDAIRRVGATDLTGITLFDIFESKEIGRDRRSLAYTLEFRSPSRTLTDDEVNESLQKAIRSLRENLAVEIREG